MLKKIIFVMVVVSLVATTCFARISASRIVLGGLAPGCSLQYAESVYGPAKKVYIKRVSKAQPEFYYVFGESFYCSPTFEEIYIDTKNGVKTADGITVGSSANDVLLTYGNPDNTVYGDNLFYDHILTYDAYENTDKPPYLVLEFYIKDNVVRKVSVFRFHH